MSGLSCPVCGTAIDAPSQITDGNTYDCPQCGKFVLGHEFRAETLEAISNWQPVMRAALSHHIRTRKNVPSIQDLQLPIILLDRLEELVESGLKLPIPTEQVRNLIRFLGDQERNTGEKLSEPPRGLIAIVGASNRDALMTLFDSAKNKGSVNFTLGSQKIGNTTHVSTPVRIYLTLDGWEEWERIHKGVTSSRDGFIAMDFREDEISNFIKEIVQNRVANKLGVQIHRVDSPDKTRAGLIDNIMREAIEDAAFVLVELSHGNRGAYWEAGLAEGLGKPVIYLCEKCIWDDPPHDKKVHFDVNHRTTVMWNKEKPDKFVKDLVATIKNSRR